MPINLKGVRSGNSLIQIFKQLNTYLYQGLNQAAPLRQCVLQLKLSLKKTAKGTICPLQNLGKKLERKHTRRDLVQYRNCKL